MKANKPLPLSKHLKVKHVNWWKKHLKNYFSTFIFINECGATLTGSDE